MSAALEDVALRHTSELLLFKFWLVACLLAMHLLEWIDFGLNFVDTLLRVQCCLCW